MRGPSSVHVDRDQYDGLRLTDGSDRVGNGKCRSETDQLETEPNRQAGFSNSVQRMRRGCEVAVSDEVEKMFRHAVRKDGRGSHVPESRGTALEQTIT